MRKKIITAIAIGLLGISVFAQGTEPAPALTQNRHEISIWGGGGFSTFNYCHDLTKGNFTPGFGFIAGLGYNYFFNYNWSLGIGAEFSALNYATKVNLPLMEDYYTQPMNDGKGGLWEVKTEGLGDVSEKYSPTYYINVPLMAKYQVDMNKKGHKFYTAFGAKLGIPIPDAKYNTSGTVRTTGQAVTANGEAYSYDWFSEGAHGFGESDAKTEGKLDLNLNVMASVEAGFKWNLGKLCALYTGLYLDYGLNDIRKDKKHSPYYEYNMTEESFSANSVMYSKYNGTDFAKFVNTASFGLKLQLSFGLSPFEKGSKANRSRRGGRDGNNATKVEVINFPDGNKPVTANQMQQMLKNNTEAAIAAEREEFEKLKQFLTPKETDEILLLPIVGFDFNKKEVLPSMQDDLNKAVEYLRINSNVKVKLVGNTDNSGTTDYNFQLGLDRANTIRAYLIDRGISPARLLVDSKGTENPAVPNTDEASRRYNRRVEFEIMK